MAWRKFVVCIAVIAFLIQLLIPMSSIAEIRFENEREIYDLLLESIPPGTHRNDVLRILGSPEEAPVTGYENFLSWVLYENETLEMIVVKFDNDISVVSGHMEHHRGERAYENSLERYEFLRNDLYGIFGLPTEEVPQNAAVWIVGEIPLFLTRSRTEQLCGIMSVILLTQSAPQGLLQE